MFLSLSLSKKSRAFLHVGLVVLVIIGSTIAHLKLGMNLPQSVYETLRTFIIEAEVELPEGTMLANVIWFLRFAAPALMAWGLLEMLRELGVYIPPIGWRNHIIIVGAGKVGTLVVDKILKDTNLKVVLLDTNPKAPGFSELRGRRNVKFQVADATSATGLNEALIQRATHVFALTDDDITNIEIATAAMQACIIAGDRTPPQIFAQVSDTSFSKQIADNLLPEYKKNITFINIFQLAARQLIDAKTQSGELRNTTFTTASDRPTLFLIAGFGRFGQALLDELTLRFDKRPDIKYLIIDSRGEKAWADYFRRSDTLFYGDHDSPMRKPITEDILSEVVTNEIHATLKNGWDVNLLISTDNDIRNLQLAMEFGRSKRLRNMLGQTLEEGTEGMGHVHLVTRLFRKPTFLVNLDERQDGEDHGIKTFNLDELVVNNIMAKLGPRKTADATQQPEVSPTIASA